MAEVQLALQRGPAGFEKLVVVKLVHDNLATQKAFVDMLLDEARVAALVKHPNVVDIYDLGQANGRFFIAMEYLEGEPLLAVLRAGREGKRLDPLSTGRLIADTAEGLDAAHELRSMSGERIELVHHDISLGNIVVLYNGQVKLVDFGVAKASQSAVTSGKSKVQGKFSYMAPEKLKGAPGDRRSDIFSLGCVMWEALTLKRLFRGNNDAETMRQVLDLAIQPPSKVNGEVPAEYDPIVMRALDRDPNKRQLTAKELAVEIEELLRKRGYGAKNDKISRYMQDTFKPHIDARKKLVQEVVAKGSASAEVLDAAFNDGGLASGSMPTPVSPEFARGTAVLPDDGVPSHLSGAEEASHPTEIAPSPFPVDTGMTAIADMAETQVRLAPAPPESKGLRALLEDPKKRMMVIGIGSAVLVVLLVVIVVGLTGSSKDKDKPQQTEAWLETPGSGSEAAGNGSADPQQAQVTAPVGSAGSAGSGSAGSAEGSDEADIVIDKHTTTGRHHEHHDHGDHGEHPHHVTTTESGSGSSAPPPASETVEQLYQKGLAAYTRGDNQAALAALTKAKSANAKFPDTYRVLGFVYERMGDKSSAKVSYLRYLALRPSAADADQVRKRLEKIL
jgi:serine/threonine-protein kinase